jgi:transcriptional regulator with PAS, ATPase and Fis domain
MIESGSFRSDLYFRINTVELYLPPLRDRREDILDLVAMYLDYFNKKYQASIDTVSKEAKSFLLTYDWPGNIRQLRQVIERCVLFAKDNSIEKEVLLSQGINMQEEPRGFPRNSLAKQYKEAKQDFDKLYFGNALHMTDNNVSEVAKISGMNRAYIYQKIKELGLCVN